MKTMDRLRVFLWGNDGTVEHGWCKNSGKVRNRG